MVAMALTGMQSEGLPVWAPKKGTKTIYHVTVNGKTEQGAFSAEAQITQTVTKSDKNGVTFKRESDQTIIRMNGQEIQDTRKPTTEISFDASGKLLGVKSSEKGGALRLTRATTFVPSGNGKSGWEVNYPAADGVPAATLKCLVSPPDPNVRMRWVKVTYTYTETGVTNPWSGVGSWLVDPHTGQTMETSVQIKNWLDTSGSPGTYESKVVEG